MTVRDFFTAAPFWGLRPQVFPPGRIARPAGSRRFKFQQLPGHPLELSSYGRTREPEGIPREISHVLAAVFGALKESGTTKANVANELDLYAADVDALIFGLSAITAAPSGGRRRRDTRTL